MVEKIKTEISKAEISRMEVGRTAFLPNLLAKKAIPMTGITYWEELTCVGFNPELAQLEAVVSVKRSTGYNGGLCSDGSTEYVRFFVDWGSGFQDVGLTSFKAHDISEAPPGPQHPLQYMVYLELDDDTYKKCCDIPVMPKVRAVLSWNQIPSLDPNDIPYYGNQMDVDIQIKPLDTNIRCLMNKGLFKKDLTILDNIDVEKALPKLEPVPVPWSKLAADYREAKVPDHRLVYEVAYPIIKGGEAMSAAATQKDLPLIGELKIDIAKITDILAESKANTTYEEVVCAGLNTASDILGAVIHVKRPCGYSGNLCQTGSKEYVAFWADWDNNGTYDAYLGTANVDVHDIPNIPSDGLYYSVMLPANLAQHLKDCTDPNIVRIRAVLSWAVPPSTIDPNDLNYWGNRLDVVVQIRPGVAVEGTELMDLLYTVGGVPIDNISPTTYLANPSTGILDTTNCGVAAMDRPFGGNVKIRGRIYNTGTPESVYYKVEYSPLLIDDWQPVTYSHIFSLVQPLQPTKVKTIHSSDGWFPYMEDPTASPQILEMYSMLAVWNTGSLEGEYRLRLAYTKDYPLAAGSVIHHSDEVTIMLDNTNYTVSPTANTVLDTAYKLDLVIDGGDCHSYAQGDTFQGHLRALDKHFWKWVLELQPITHTSGTQANPRCRSYGSSVDQGDSNAVWTLDTTNLDKCGYTLTLWAYDRTIINSNGAIVHWNKKAVGFSVV